MRQASLPVSPLSLANPAEDGIALLNLLMGRNGPPLAFQSEMMVLFTLSAVPGSCSALSRLPHSWELPWPFRCPSLVLEKALSSWQDKCLKIAVGPWARCSGNHPFPTYIGDF